MRNKKTMEIVIAEDDADDRMLIEDAFLEGRLRNKITFVENGEVLFERLYCRGRFADRQNDNLPGLILLDLNMPRMDGREALALLKKNPAFRRIPVVILTTSKAEEDIVRSYDLGVNSFISKPVTFDGLVNIVTVLNSYWIEIVQIPEVAALVDA